MQFHENIYFICKILESIAKLLAKIGHFKIGGKIRLRKVQIFMKLRDILTVKNQHILLFQPLEIREGEKER